MGPKSVMLSFKVITAIATETFALFPPVFWLHLIFLNGPIRFARFISITQNQNIFQMILWSRENAQ